jgi:hypothetical protein
VGWGPPPPPPGPQVIKQFSIFWIDDDLAVSHYEGIVGSAREGRWLFLLTQDGLEIQINLNQVLRINIWTEP